MSRLSLNYDSLKGPCLQNLNEAISKLDNAINIFNSLNIPYNYRRRQGINNVRNSITKKRKELISIKNWIIGSNNDFTTITNEFCKRADKLPRVKFGERKGIK